MIRFDRMRKWACVVLAWGALVTAAGCEKIHEPWVAGPDDLRAERARPAHAQMVLRHRIFRVQVDR